MRCAGFHLRVWRLCCVIWIGCGVLEAETPRLQSAENAHFEIVALDVRSVNYVEQLSRHIVEASEQLLNRRQMNFPQRILVRLKPAQYADFEGAYRMTIGERGFVTLDLLWEENLSLAQCCHALSEALLLRYAFYNFGPSAAENLRGWTVGTLGTRAFLKLRPALQKALAEEFRQSPPPSLEVLLSKKWDALPQEGSGYWFFQSLKQSGFASVKIRELYLAAVEGGDVTPMLFELVQSKSSISPEDWWAQVLPALASEERAVFEGLASSRQWIGEFAEFELEGKPANLKQVWMEREAPAVREMLEARLELLRIRIARVNPAYFNAARSLGLLFETMLESDQSHEFIRGLSQFLGDFEETKKIERIVGEQLRLPEG